LNYAGENRRAERAYACKFPHSSVESRQPRFARRLFRFPPPCAVCGTSAAVRGGCSVNPGGGNRRAGAARGIAKSSRRPIRDPGAVAGLAGRLRGRSRDRDAPNRAAPRFLTRLWRKIRIRFGRRRFVPVLFPHGPPAKTVRSQKCRRIEVLAARACAKLAGMATREASFRLPDEPRPRPASRRARLASPTSFQLRRRT
jgi:hypothetical protein